MLSENIGPIVRRLIGAIGMIGFGVCLLGIGDRKSRIRGPDWCSNNDIRRRVRYHDSSAYSTPHESLAFKQYSLMLLALLFQIFVSANATLHPAKRAIPFCGLAPVDCGDGWCCSFGMKCTADDPPLCEDLLILSFTISAAPYSEMDPDRLTSIGLTISTFPRTTLTATTAWPTYSYSENIATGTRSLLFIEPTAVETVVQTISQTGAAVPSLEPGIAVGGVFAACVGMWMRI